MCDIGRDYQLGAQDQPQHWQDLRKQCCNLMVSHFSHLSFLPICALHMDVPCWLLLAFCSCSDTSVTVELALLHIALASIVLIGTLALEGKSHAERIRGNTCCPGCLMLIAWPRQLLACRVNKGQGMPGRFPLTQEITRSASRGDAVLMRDCLLHRGYQSIRDSAC